MRILTITFSFPSPARSGAERRLENLLNGLLARHEVGIVALRRGEPDPRFAARFGYAGFVDPPAPREPLRFGLGAVRAWSGLVFGSLPGFARATGTREFGLAVDHAVAEFKPDAVFIEPVDPAPLIPRIKRLGIPVCLGTIELVGEKMRRWMDLAETHAHRFAGRREISRTRALESAALRGADAVTCVSEEDRRAIKSWSGVDASVVPNAVDAAFFAPQGHEREPAAFLALGPLTYPANLDAAMWFDREILPLLPGARFDVIGRAPTMGATFGARTRGLGMVDDVRPYLARATALVAPLRIGGGTRLKILEALAMRTPVVSTPLGIEGLGLEDEQHVLLAADATSFARQAKRIAEDPDLGDRLGRKGSELVAHRYNWERSVEALEAALARIARPASRTPR
ncbi:MAG: glycosyltransferase family 4 protein [Actinomycetota bacterium]|nr:glycosyltransferase family 4 protein [Actinomycetota bacterium]